MKTMAEGELHDGGSTSFTLVFLTVASRAIPEATTASVAMLLSVRILRMAVVGRETA
jgi:MFS superfamily sulfate permease-like transporter